MSERTERIKKSAHELQQRAADFKAEAGQVMAHPDFSTDYKRGQVARLQADAEARAVAYAKSSRQSAQKAVEAARAELRAAHHARAEGADYARRAWLLVEYQAMLQRGPDWTRGEASPARRVAELYSQLQEAGDTEGMAVLRIAAAPVLDAALASDDNGDAAGAALALSLKREMKADEERQNAPIDEARREVAELERAAGELDRAILATETSITGRAMDWTQQATPWAVDVLGVARANVA